MTGSKCTNLSSEPTVLGGEGDIEGGLAEEAQRKKQERETRMLKERQAPKSSEDWIAEQ
jgi:hypothetical protein